MQISIVAVGKLRSVPLRELCADYLGRLGRYGAAEVLETRAVADGSGLKVVAEEGKRLLEVLERFDRIWVLDERGRMVGSTQLAGMLADCELQSVKRLAVVLGGAYGLSDGVRSKGQLLSLSRLTFPHEICRLIVLEQLYRARTIQRGEPYHHQ